MEQVKVALGYLRKYHFWLLCVLAVVAGVVGWMMAGSAMSDEYNKGKSAVAGKFSSLEQIHKNPNPPNSTWTEEVDKLTQEEQKKVEATWKSVFEAQQKVLHWPDGKVMGNDFRNWIVSQPASAEIPQGWCTYYRDNVANKEFDKLPEIVGAKLEVDQPKEPGATTTTADEAEDEPERTYRVFWERGSQEEVKKALEMPGVGVPSSLAVRLKQEDLWVYRALLDIINSTNSTAQFTSHVKVISGISIGAAAAKLFQEGMKAGHIERAAQEGPGEAAANPTSSDAPVDPATAAPDEGRYVSADGTPQSSGTWQGEQIKRMPIYLRLVMDQREIPRLLAHCANAPLPVEVKQLRINPDAKAAAGTSDDVASPTAAGPYDVTVEINGIVSIYNPPDPARLGQGGDGAAAAAAM